MSQYQRKLQKGIRWWYKFDYNGQTYTSPCIYLSKQEAKKAEADRLSQLEIELTRIANGTDTITLLDAVNERLDYVQTAKSNAYYKDNQRYYKILIHTLGAERIISTIKKADILDVLMTVSKRQKERGGDNYVVNTMLNIYKALFNHIINKHELTMANPCRKINHFSVEKKMKYIPPEEDIDAIKALCDEGQKLLIEFVDETACRINEALRLTGSDLHEEVIVLYTRKSKNSNLTPRKVPLPECLKGRLYKPDEKVFGRWIDTPKFLERKVRELNQKKWQWHNLRHRRASIWSKEKRPIFEIMSLLGHSNLKTTQGYLQLIP